MKSRLAEPEARVCRKMPRCAVIQAAAVSCFSAFPRHDLALLRRQRMGPVATGRPLRPMSPGLRLRRRPPPLLARQGLPAATGLGFGILRQRSKLRSTEFHDHRKPPIITGAHTHRTPPTITDASKHRMPPTITDASKHRML